MTDEQREREIRERVERATPGPWRLGWPVCVCALEHEHDGKSCDYRISEWYDGLVDGYSPVYVDAPFGAPPVEIADNEEGGLRTPDADFIAHAREDVPWLLARLDEARRELDALRDVGERASRENARMIRVVDAALTWWRRHRPVDWDEAEHLRYPLVNTTTDAEKNLARAVADYVAAHGHKTEDA